MGDAAASASTPAPAPATPTSTLICREDGNDLFADADADDGGGGGGDFSVDGDDYLLLLDRDEEYVALMLSKESVAASGGGGSAPGEEMEEWMKAARAGCVGWIVKTNARFRFSGKTAYVAVTYLDRFLAHRRVHRGKEWALQLLSVACLSLAAKVEERRAPRLPEFRLDKYDFDSASILRMELLVLGTLKWQMITGTPFSYLSCFAARFRHDERKAIILRAVQCIFASIKVMNSIEYQPSTIALASILVARNKEKASPNLDELKVILGSSWQQLDTGHVYSCYSVMIQEDRSMQSREVASSSVSVAHIASSESSMGANNATTSAATPDNKRKRLHSPQRQ